LDQDTRCASVAKHRHGQADLGDDHLGGVTADAGHLVQAIHRIEWNPRGVAVLSAARPWRLGGGDVGDELFDAGIEVFDLCAEGVYLLQQQGGDLCAVVVEAAGERIDKGGVLDPQPCLGQIGEHPRVAFPGDQRLDHCPAGHAPRRPTRP
jgi:hypothetical protein